MPRKSARPSVGDVVRVKDHWTETYLVGPVDWLGSSHFTFLVEGQTYTCQYSGDWTHELRSTDDPEGS